MKKYSIVLIVVAWIGIALQTQAQGTVAKLKYEDAEKAFYDGNYQDCINLLDETEKLLGKSAPNILHLRIMAQNQLFSANPYQNPEIFEQLHRNCKTYMSQYDRPGLEGKFREVYEVSHKLPTLESYYAALRKKEENQQKARQIMGDSGIPLVFVEGGEFAPGANAGVDGKLQAIDQQRAAVAMRFMMAQGQSASAVKKDEFINHVKSATSVADFLIGRHEVTVAQFGQFVTETGYKTSAEKKGYSDVWTGRRWKETKGANWQNDGLKRKENSGVNHPVIHVSYDDAMAYCQWLSQKYGGTWRLPTETEWEYAARGGNKSKGYTYSGSNDINEVAWWDENSENVTQPVGKKLPNELGIYDMTGNVGELCYGVNTQYGRNVIRGGSVNAAMKYSKITEPLFYDSSDNSSCVRGFRVVLVLDN